MFFAVPRLLRNAAPFGQVAEAGANDSSDGWWLECCSPGSVRKKRGVQQKSKKHPSFHGELPSLHKSGKQGGLRLKQFRRH